MTSPVSDKAHTYAGHWPVRAPRVVPDSSSQHTSDCLGSTASLVPGAPACFSQAESGKHTPASGLGGAASPPGASRARAKTRGPKEHRRLYSCCAARHSGLGVQLLNIIVRKSKYYYLQQHYNIRRSSIET